MTNERSVLEINFFLFFHLSIFRFPSSAAATGQFDADRTKLEAHTKTNNILYFMIILRQQIEQTTFFVVCESNQLGARTRSGERTNREIDDWKLQEKEKT